MGLKRVGSDSSLEAQIQACRLRFKPGGLDSSLEAQIEAWSLRFKPVGSDSSLPGASDSSLEASIAENDTETLFFNSISNAFG